MAFKGKANPIPKGRWREQKDKIARLYLHEDRPTVTNKQGVKGVVEIMADEDGFVATKAQYEAKFRSWGWKKNYPKSHWLQICAIVKHRKDSGEDSEVFIDGVRWPDEKINDKISRLNHELEGWQADGASGDVQLPKGVFIRSPRASLTSTWTIDLPFHVFDRHIQERIRAATGSPSFDSLLRLPDPAIPRRAENQSASKSIEGGTTSNSVIYYGPDSPFFTVRGAGQVLETILPSSMMARPTFRKLPMTMFNSVVSLPRLRETMFSMSNNFAGLGPKPLFDITKLIHRMPGVELTQLIAAAPCHAGRAIAEKLFKMAIENGDSHTIRALLQEKKLGINPDQEIITIVGEFYTPIELASYLHHKAVIQELLAWGVDVDKTLNSSHVPCGALEHFLRGRPKSGRIDSKIVFMLLDAGNRLTSDSMMAMISNCEPDQTLAVMSREAFDNHLKWSEKGVFRHAILSMPVEAIRPIIAIMREVDADLNHHVGGNEHYPISTRLERHLEAEKIPKSILDAVIYREEFQMALELLSDGVSLTPDTLVRAIQSGNQELIQFLLDRGADANSMWMLGQTPLAAAITLQDESVLELLLSNGALEELHKRSHFSGQRLILSALKAAIRVGNMRFIKYFLHMEGQIGPDGLDLGRALIVAARNGRIEIAHMLLDAGATFESWTESEALLLAVRQGSESLVYSLLDSGVKSDSGAMVTAIEQRSTEMLELLITEEIDSGSLTRPLVHAVKLQAEDLVNRLLEAGADANGNPRSDPTPLGAAVRNGDIRMVRTLLEYGADPQDSGALTSALDQEVDLVILLLEQHRARYPKGRRKFGGKALQKAIQREMFSTVEVMLTKGVNPNELTGEWALEASAFGSAIAHEPEDMRLLELLTDHGCDPESIVSVTRTGHKVTALLAAIGTSKILRVKFLVGKGADVNRPPRLGIHRSPLQRAAEIGSMEIANFLMEHGADVNCPPATRAGATALQLAAINGHCAMVEEFLARHAEVDAPKCKVDGRTALEGAAEHGRLDTVALLLNAGAASEGHDKSQLEQAVFLAKKQGNFATAEFLEDFARSTWRPLETSAIGDASSEVVASQADGEGGHEADEDSFSDIMNWDPDDS